MAGKRKRSLRDREGSVTPPSEASHPEHHAHDHHRSLVSALAASHKSAAPLRRLLSCRGVLSSVVLFPTSSEAGDATALTLALSSMHGACIAQLLSVLYDEVKCRRNTAAVVRFVAWVVTLRYGSDQQLIPGGDGWIPCLAFMIAYDAMLDRVERLGGIHGNNNNDSSDILEDGIVSTSIQVAQQVRNFDTTRINGTSQIDMPSLVQRCFTRQLSRFDAIVTGLEDNMRQHTSKKQVSSQANEQFGDTSTKVNARDWWDGVDLPSSSEEDNNGGGGGGGGDNEGENETESRKRAERELPGILQGVDSNENDCAETDNPMSLPAPEEDDWPIIEKAAADLRDELIELSNGATSSDIQSYSDRITELIHRSGAGRGASGVTDLGSILAYGSTVADGNTAVGSCRGPSPLTDLLIQQMTKRVVDGSTSAIRAEAFIRSFVLPVVAQVGCDSVNGKKKVAVASSRILTSTITFLTKERPLESVEALFIPLLCCRDKGTGEPNQAQCELIVKVLKSAQLPPDAITKFVRLVVKMNAMIWTDSSIPILTTLLTKRVALSDEVVRDISSIIEQKSVNLCKNLKFSALFLSFVTNHGSEVKKADCIDTLVLSAQKLKTFSGKSIGAALKKLSRK